MFSCEFCETSKKIYFYITPLVDAFDGVINVWRSAEEQTLDFAETVIKDILYPKLWWSTTNIYIFWIYFLVVF